MIFRTSILRPTGITSTPISQSSTILTPERYGGSSVAVLASATQTENVALDHNDVTNTHTDGVGLSQSSDSSLLDW